MLEDRTVLIVDDDPINIFALSAVLKTHGINCVSAANGEEGIDVLKSNPSIDIALIDIMMPGIDGYETVRRIRNDAEYRDFPIVSVTAQAMKGDKEKCLEAGASAYVSKPIDPERLMMVMDGLLV